MTIPGKKLLLLSTEDFTEGVILRGIVEEFGTITVHRHPIGLRSDLVHILNTNTDYDMTVLCGHGSDGAFCMPELGEELYASEPFRGNMMPEHVTELLTLTGQKILSLCCYTGYPEMVKAFLDAGSEWYIAPDDFPDGSAAIVFATNLIYNYLHCGQTIDEAIRNSINEYDESRFFKLFKK